MLDARLRMRRAELHDHYHQEIFHVRRTDERAQDLRRHRPKLAEITDKVLFGDVWTDDTLSARDRSLVTIINLAALYRHNEIGFHLKGLVNGLTPDEVIAAITQTAFYAG